LGKKKRQFCLCQKAYQVKNQTELNFFGCANLGIVRRSLRIAACFLPEVSVTVCARKYCQILLLGALVPAAIAFGAGNPDGNSRSAEQFVPGKDSYRASFELSVPRRFATRYLKDTRSLEIRISPAKSEEFDVTRYYDTRFIHRVLVEEKNNDVVLSFQLKNAPVSWYVTHQDNPWRIVVDIWKTEPTAPRNLEREWAWQDDASGKTREPQQGAVSPVKSVQAATVRPVEIDLPDDAIPTVLPKTTPANAEIAPVNKAAQSAAAAVTRHARLEPVVPTAADVMAGLERRAGMDVGAIAEFDSLEKLATALYKAGAVQQAIPLFRRLATLNARRFQDSPRLLWMAGESAYLADKADLASDYLQTLQGRHPGQEHAALAEFRLADLKVAKLGDAAANDTKDKYSELTLNEKAPWSARIGSAVRLLEPVIASRPEAARAHQAALQNCLNGNYVSEQFRQTCAYIQTKFAVSQTDAVSADAVMQRFKSRYPTDPRVPVLEAELSNRVRFILDEYSKKKEFAALADFERKARPGLLDFTLREPELLMARVEGWLSVGETKKALALLQVFVGATTDEAKKNESYALMAQLHLKQKQSERAEAALRKLFNSDVRKNTGLTDRATAALREAARAPYSSKTAQLVLIDELKFGRYVERDVGMLAALAAAARGRDDADKLFDTLMTTAPRNDDEARQIETTLMQYADDLRGNGRLAKAGDVYLGVANIGQSSKKAEAAYKAGLMYARAGMVEKAKTAWQLSAADLTDKKFSSLASERLERIR
jgi:tetratricopeptide (TPR) repeat protein